MTVVGGRGHASVTDHETYILPWEGRHDYQSNACFDWVKDQDEALKFYHDTLGFKVVSDNATACPAIAG